MGFQCFGHAIAQTVFILGANLRENLYQVLRTVIGELNVSGESTAQTRVGINELVHLFGIAGHNHHKAIPVVFHALQQYVHRLVAVAVFCVLRRQTIGFVDEQHPIHGLVDDAFGFHGGLTQIPGHQFGAIHFHQMAFFQNSQFLEDASVQTGHGGLSCAWRTRENAV